MSKVLVHVVYREAFVCPTHTKAFFDCHYTVELFFLSQEYRVDKGVILDYENFVFVRQDYQKGSFGGGLPRKIVESALFLNFKRDELLMLFENVLLGMELPQSQITFPHEEHRFRLERVEGNVLNCNAFDTG